jgi:DsbC/DsbD-like thiol-disulfide interchange protein
MSVLGAVLVAQSPASFSAAPSAQANIGVNGFFSADKAQRGRTIQAAVVMDIPEGFHVNSNKPLSKYSIPTTIKIDAPGGVRVGPVSYPRAVVRRFKFEGRSEEERLAVYEGRAVMRFNVTVPADFEPGVTELRVRVRYQSCDDRVCYPPATRDITLPVGIVGASDPVRRINGQIFGGGGSRSPRRGRRG